MTTHPAMNALLQGVMDGRDMTEAEAATAMDEIMSGRATSAQIAGLLVGLAMKGERVDEIVGLARTMREHAVSLEPPVESCFDTCGTGGDRSHTFNVSSAAAVTLAACGVTVAKHGNRSVSSRSGSADVFEALGVQITASPGVVRRCLADAGIAFLFAPTFHPSMRHAGPTRRELGVRTAFNLLGPLTNPAGARRQIVGVPRPELTELMAQALAALGSERAWVVHGADGLDEISTTGETHVAEVVGGDVRSFVIGPDAFGLPTATLDALRVEGVEASVAMVRSVLDGTAGAPLDIVLANAAAGLMLADRVSTLPEGVALARDALAAGRGRDTLEAMVSASSAEVAHDD